MDLYIRKDTSSKNDCGQKLLRAGLGEGGGGLDLANCMADTLYSFRDTISEILSILI